MLNLSIFGAVSAAIAVMLWAARIPQLIAFLLAAAAQRHTPSSRTNPRTALPLWEAKPSSGAPAERVNAKAMITYHAEYHSFDPALAQASLASCLKLGAGWIRTDIRWNRVLPDGFNPDARAIAWYRQFLATARDYGLKNMVVLSTPPTAVQKSNAGNRLAAWARFVDLVVNELGSSCDAYQLMNEPNSPAYGFFSRSDCAQALKQAQSIIRRSCPNAPIAINIAMDMWGWRNYLEDILRGSDSAVNIVGLDHYPGTWTVGWGDRWNSIIELANKVSIAADHSIWSNRELAIFETGYCTNAPLRTEREQATYFQNMRGTVQRLKDLGALSLLGIYELCDADSAAGLNPEGHFGIMTSELRPKSAFATVVELFRTF